MKKLLVIALLVSTSTANFIANATEVTYSNQENAQAKAFYIAEYQTRYCMHTYASTLLRMGMRDQKQIVENMVKTCSGKFKATISAYNIPMHNLTDNYLESMAYDELHYIPGLNLAVN